MSARFAIRLGVYASLVPLLSAAGAGRPTVAAAVVALEAPAVSATDQLAAAQSAAPATDVPVRSSRLERHDASRGLAQLVRSIPSTDPGPSFLAWTVPSLQNEHGDHDWRDGDTRCVIGSDDRIRTMSHHKWQGNGPGTRTLVILARRTGQAIDRVSFGDARCEIDAGSRRVHWLDAVQPSESVSLLADVISSGTARAEHDGALAAIALTDDPAADQALERLTVPSTPREVRKQAAFWLGAARGAAGARVIDRLAQNDKDDDFREHLTFVLTLTGDAGLDRLIDMARHDSASDVRSQALFWLSQKAGERAAGTIGRAVDEDPISEVRKLAVFAISQLPQDEAVPRLIALAQTHKDPGVRKQAMFWLGQSGDPRALEMFERILAH
jgi:HEAT repeat protein